MPRTSGRRPDWEKREKLAEARWGVTCTRQGADHLRRSPRNPDRVTLLYHGLDLSRFPPPPETRPARDGSNPADPVRIVSVGRAVPRRASTTCFGRSPSLPEDLHWRFVHVGGGDLLEGPEVAGVPHRDCRAMRLSRRQGSAAGRETARPGGPLRPALEGGAPRAIGTGFRTCSWRRRARSSRSWRRLRRNSGVRPRSIEGGWCRRATGRRCRTRSTCSRGTRPAARRSGAAAFERLRGDFAMDRGIDVLAPVPRHSGGRGAAARP